MQYGADGALALVVLGVAKMGMAVRILDCLARVGYSLCKKESAQRSWKKHECGIFLK